MLNTLKKLGELARVIKDETRVSLDISECAAVADFCASSSNWNLDECIENLNGENNDYGASNKLFIGDINKDNNIINDIISWGVREIVAYRIFTNLKGYTHIDDMWEKLDEDTRIKHLSALALEFYKMGKGFGGALEAIQETYLGAGIRITVDMKYYNEKYFLLARIFG